MKKPMGIVTGLILFVAATAGESVLQAQQSAAKPATQPRKPAAVQPKAAAQAPKPAAKPAPAQPKPPAKALKPPAQKAAQVPNHVARRNSAVDAGHKNQDRTVESPVSVASTLDDASKDSQKKKAAKKSADGDTRDEPKP